MTRLEHYLKKSGDDKIYTSNLIENEHGFASFQICDESLVLLNIYGDGTHWDEYFTNMAKELGLKSIKFGTRRNYKTFKRKFGYQLVGYILEKEV